MTAAVKQEFGGGGGGVGSGFGILESFYDLLYTVLLQLCCGWNHVIDDNFSFLLFSLTHDVWI